MSLVLHDISAPAFLRGLHSLSGLVDKAIQSGVDEAVLMDARLAPDMKPFPDQIRMAAFSARSCIGRLTSQAWPKTDDAEATLTDLKETIACRSRSSRPRTRRPSKAARHAGLSCVFLALS
ncbi:DUF1993 family protein [Brevundimonas sp.]|uniref:DUF1993 family protein n=1 Tax=Brevundimonas sp. TaxID=1871086 RepID=UPI003565604D